MLSYILGDMQRYPTAFRSEFGFVVYYISLWERRFSIPFPLSCLETPPIEE
jgi:hypothetical protein